MNTPRPQLLVADAPPGAQRAWGILLSIAASACSPPAVPPSANDAAVATASVVAAPEASSPIPSVESAILAPPVESAILAPPRPRPPPHVPPRDCNPGGPPPRACVLPGETEGAVVKSGLVANPIGCRENPRASVCRACRPVFSNVEKGRCCYYGLSRFLRCKD